MQKRKHGLEKGLKAGYAEGGKPPRRGKKGREVVDILEPTLGNPRRNPTGVYILGKALYIQWGMFGKENWVGKQGNIQNRGLHEPL